MKGSTHIDWIRGILVLAVVVAAGVMVATAGAVGRPPDVQDAASVSSSADVATPPDVKDAATFLYSTPAGLQADGLRLQREAQVYKQLESSNGPTALGQKADGMRLQAMAQAYKGTQSTPDAFERYAAQHPFGQGLPQVSQTVVGRPPDVTDAALSVETASVSSSTGFEWSDWGIGIGTGVGIALILGAGLIAGRGLRHRSIQTA
jgi:hypothetical protein